MTIITVLFTSCYEMKTEWDISADAFPPKLCITAILDGANGTFSILISEGRALADYKKPFQPATENKRNGEVRLYEDDRLILTEAGIFDLAHINDDVDYAYGDYGGWKIGHSIVVSDIDTHPGSTYRLIVEVEGYKSVSSVSTMPLMPDVSVSIDTTAVITKEATIKRYTSLAGWFSGIDEGIFSFWPVTLSWGDRPAGRNYYVLEMYVDVTAIEDNEFYGLTQRDNCNVIVEDRAKLLDNPEVSILENQGIDLELTTQSHNMFQFPILLMSDAGFTDNNASLTLYKMLEMVIEQQPYFPPYFPPNNEQRTLSHCVLNLRVRQITEATYKYYHSLTLQLSIGIDYFVEPVNIVGNIENGYGGFTVFSSADFQLVTYDAYYDWYIPERLTQ
jgi:hypothetical protein